MAESIQRLAARAARLGKPADGLRATAELRRRLLELEAAHVENALRTGWSWAQIAESLGVTKQAAHRKYARVMARNLAGDESDERSKFVVTAAARRSVWFARREADVLTADAVEPEHLLLGLCCEDGGAAVRTLGGLGISLESVRREVGRLVRGRAKARRAGEQPSRLPIAPRTRSTLEQSLREAMRLRHPHLGVEHILLALLRDEDSGAVKVLEALGTTTVEVEERLEREL